MTELLQWFQDNTLLITVVAVTSVVVFLATLIVVPIVICRIPSDYFTGPRRRERATWLRDNRAIWLLWVIGKNLLGAVLVLLGLIMLITPGQGILAIVLGLAAMDFPGKYRLERWVVSRRVVYRSVNWWRRYKGRAPLQVPGIDD